MIGLSTATFLSLKALFVSALDGAIYVEKTLKALLFIKKLKRFLPASKETPPLTPPLMTPFLSGLIESHELKKLSDEEFRKALPDIILHADRPVIDNFSGRDWLDRRGKVKEKHCDVLLASHNRHFQQKGFPITPKKCIITNPVKRCFYVKPPTTKGLFKLFSYITKTYELYQAQCNNFVCVLKDFKLPIVQINETEHTLHKTIFFSVTGRTFITVYASKRTADGSAPNDVFYIIPDSDENHMTLVQAVRSIQRQAEVYDLSNFLRLFPPSDLEPKPVS